MSNSIANAPSKWFNPLVLQWAREQSAYQPEEAERELKIEPGTVRTWEEGLRYPDIEMLRRLSRLYDIPFSYFFLETPPEAPQFIDYRGVPEPRRKKLSRDTQLALREFRRLSSLAITLQQVTGQPSQVNIGQAYTHEIPEDVANREANRIQINSEIRKRFLTKEDAYQTWRGIVERLGIFVFSLHMPSSECRGAAINERDYATAILVNQNEPATARSFTLFHEYCHLMLSTTTRLMVCDHFPGDTETFSNRFASSILLPQDEFIKYLNDKELSQYRERWPNSILSELAREFSVSRDVVAIRLEDIELAPSGFYRRKRQQWDKQFRGKGGFGHGGKNKRNYAQEKTGPTFLSTTLSAVRSKIFHPVDAALCIGQVRGGKRPWHVNAKDIESWVKE